MKNFIEKFDKLENLQTCNYDTLTSLYRKINEKRSELDKTSKELKKREDALKSILIDKMNVENIDSVKTKAGLLSLTTSESIITQDFEAFIEWLRQDPERVTILSKKPYTQEKVKAIVDEENKELPPGLGWYRELKLSIRKA